MQREEATTAAEFIPVTVNGIFLGNMYSQFGCRASVVPQNSTGTPFVPLLLLLYVPFLQSLVPLAPLMLF